MNPISPDRCLECDAPLAAGVAGGLCPKCLLKLGLASQFGETSIGEAGARRVVAPPQFPFDFGGYRVLRLLGRGGMGAVYEAEQLATGRRVALKVLGQSIDSPEMRKRFLREGRLAAAVNHPNTVYIFGTEEIEGAPVIAMELIAGGTLRDEIKRRGPLPPREAVDMILQLIAGLECAAAAGVLHRDVKPENCFITTDGVVKVGDFGLSVSTLARQDTQITASGTMLGTPSYAPPEQLRGDELDVRADIYSAGATLYAVLTGQAPFRGENVVQVVANVLNTPAPAEFLHKGLPAGLADVVLRCLAKDRAKRFADYAALREALLPFSSAVAEPATPAVRFAAGLVDEMIEFLPGILFLAFIGNTEEERWLTQRTTPSFLTWLAFFFFHIAYYAIPEGRWGASVGKALFRLRVTTPTGAVPGFARATIRAALFVLAIHSTAILTAFFSSAESYRAAVAAGREIAPWWMILIFWGCLFITMRRRNGFASLMDLASGTRVVLRAATSGPRAALIPLHGAEVPADGERIGPFRVVNAPAGCDFVAASDDTLRRAVWIRRQPLDTPPLPAARKELNRATRLRWLQGVRTTTEAWDAFEAPAGRPFQAVAAESAPAWADLRHWVLDLTEELDAAAKDDTRPTTLSLGHVWITASGRAVLLDEPQNDGPNSNATLLPEELLNAIAATAERRTLPMHARQILDNFASGTLDRLSFLAGNLRSLLGRAVALDRRLRLLSLFAAPFSIAAMVLVVSLLIWHERGYNDRQWAARFPDRPPLSLILRMHLASSQPLGFYSQRWPVNDALDAAIARHIADRYTADFGGAQGLSGGKLVDLPLSEEERTLVSMLMAQYPRADAGKLLEAEAAILAVLPSFREAEVRWTFWFALYIFSSLIAILAVVQLLFVLVSNTTPGQRMFGFTVVGKTGEPADRGRMLWRWFIAWFPAGILWITSTLLFVIGEGSIVAGIFAIVAGVVWLAGLIAAVHRPDRGPHDRIAGAWLVPR